MKLERFPEGWSTLGNGIAEYSRLKFFKIRRLVVWIGVKWAINRYGQKTPSPFGKGLEGTHELRFWYFRFGWNITCW